MFCNYVKIAIRNLLRNKVSSGINILGLALGIAAFIFILEYVSLEQSFNRFHTQLPSLYRLVTQTREGDNWTDIAPAVAPLIKESFPEVQSFCRIAEQAANGVVTFPGSENNQTAQSFNEPRLAYADASFFTLFTFPVVQGNAAKALAAHNTVALSESQARKYFGRSPAMGRVITLNNQFGQTLYTVTAVYADMPYNSDLQFDAVFALETLANPANLNGNGWARLDGFDGAFLTTFFRLDRGTNHLTLVDKFNHLAKKLDPTEQDRFLLQPGLNLHLAASLSDPVPTSGSLGFVYLLQGIALLILVIAWFNYVNLSTAGALKRAKEVSIRKVIGARSRQLIVQFLGESVLLNILGFGLALILVLALQQTFNNLVNKEISLWVLQTNYFWLIGLGLLLLGSLVSGSYVAFTLVSFKPILTLKGEFQTGQGTWLRKVLVIGQFCTSVVLIIATLVLYRQLQYMQTEDLGMQLKQRVVIAAPRIGEEALLNARSAVLEQQISQLPYVQNICQTSIVPGNFYNFSADGIGQPNASPGDLKKSYSMGIIDDRFLSTIAISLAAGRNFTPLEATLGYEKSGKMLVNEAAARQLGFSSAADAVGKKVNWGQPFQIVGVVKNYHHQGLRQSIDPMILLPRRSTGQLIVQLGPGAKSAQIAQLEKLYQANYPGNNFDYYFMDERYNEQYQQEQQYGRVFMIASALAIFIASLGLFGLVTFIAEQRTKEIGIRKVLGASVSGIVAMLSKDFLKLVLVANIIAFPIAWYGLYQWLQDFAYRITIGWEIFAVAGTLTAIIALLTISFKAVKAAVANPVKSLRSE